MNQSEADRDPVEQVAEEFLRRYRAGDRPSLTEYVERYPDLAGQIRSLFPTLLMLECLPPAAAGPPGAPTPPSQAPALPERLGDYRLLRQLGRGGMGVVYEAVQESLGRHVALKVLPAGRLSGPNQLERFRREARAAARLHHTNIVPVFEIGEHEGVHFYAMQYIGGQGLDAVLEEVRRLQGGPTVTDPAGAATPSFTAAQGLLGGQFTPACPATDPSATGPVPGSGSGSQLGAPARRPYYRSVARIGMQAAEGLDYAHRQGILHRDVKPSNLLLDAQGTVWVTDFGLAKADDEHDLTSSGDVVGTLRFLAPERFQGKADARSDVYALGATLYEMVALRPALDAIDRVQLVERATRGAVPPLRQHDPHVPLDLATVIHKALEREPERRYATAGELAADLRRFLDGVPIRARRSGPAERLWAWCRRNPVVSALGAAVALLLVAVAVVTSVWAWRYSRLLAQSETKGQEAVAAARDARERLFEAKLAQARGSRLSRRAGQRFDALQAVREAVALGRELGLPPERFDSLRNEAVAALALPDLQITQAIGHAASHKCSADLSEDFELYVQTAEDGACTVRRVADDAEVARLPARGESTVAVFGPGRIVGVHGDATSGFQVWDVGRSPAVQRLEDKNVASWAFDPRGRFLAVQHGDGVLCIHDATTWTPLHRFPAGNVSFYHWRYHPTEPLLAGFEYTSRTVVVRHLHTGAIVASKESPWANGNGCGAWSPDGRTLLVPEGDGGRIQEYGFDVAPPALRPLRTLEAPYQGDPVITLNPAGDQFVTRGWSGTVHLFDASSGHLLFATPELPMWDNTMRLRFDRTGRRMAATRVRGQRDRVGVWSVAAGREYRYLAPSGTARYHWGPAIHRGGRLAAMGLSDGVSLFDLETGRELAHVAMPGDTFAHFDGAGNLLTNSFTGCFRWPVRSDPARPGRLVVGPPERLPFRKGRYPVAASQDGRVIAQAMFGAYGMREYAGGWILHPNSPTPRRVDAGTGMGWAGVSPDGRWVAFGVHSGPVNVYNAATGERVWQSPVSGSNYCCFSLDGPLLVSDAGGGRAYAAGTWEPGPHLGPGTPWDATAGLAVLGQPDGTYRLVELATGRELVRLEDLEQNAGLAAFSPDSTRLVVEVKNGLRVWDLRRLRAGLAELGLDWDAPPFPDVVGGEEVSSLELTVDRGDIDVIVSAGDVTDRLRCQGDLAGALAAIRKAQAAAPDDPDLNSYLAWLLAICPEPKLRDAKQAVQFGRKAVGVVPNDPRYLRTLAMALHFASEEREAVSMFTRSMELRGGGEAFDFLPMAAANQHLGQKEEAHKWYDRAMAWMTDHKHPYAAELAVLRADAEAALGIKKAAPPGPDGAPPDRKK
jgi:serine/threonine protein kinase/WD40 repeat protein